MDYSKMSDFEINQAIACNLNPDAYDFCRGEGESVWFKVSTYSENKDYCNNPADAWPIIVEHGIGVIPYKKGLSESWNISTGLINGTTKDANPLRAAMIVFLSMQDPANVQDNPA